MNEEKTLKAFRDRNNVDTLIAYDPDDAYKVWEEHVGSSWEYEVGEDAGWCELSNDTILTITFDDPFDKVTPSGATIEPDGEYYKKITATVEAWIEAFGRGFLCSTEW